MDTLTKHGKHAWWTVAAMLLTACGGNDQPDVAQLTPATPATLAHCADLVSGFTYANTVMTAASAVPAGTLSVGGTSIGAHCVVSGHMFDRVSAVDGQSYSIGFEMRLPNDWNGRFFFQGNHGIDGVVVPATGVTSEGGPLSNGLAMGFAVLSSDMGHTNAQNPLFGIDPQARLDYGYQAVGKLTPMAKALIQVAYGKAPDRSYIVGCSNGGRHAIIAASRYADDYDGVLAGDAGLNIPASSIAGMYEGQQFNSIATSTDLSTAWSPAERQLVAAKVLEKCDALDGVADGMVADTAACKSAFVFTRDVPTCTAARDGTCLTDAQKTAIGNVFTGARNGSGAPLYSSFPYDPGISTPLWGVLKFTFPVTLVRDPGIVAFGSEVPPEPTGVASDIRTFSLSYNFDTQAPRVAATDGTYTESALSLMNPPDPATLSRFKSRGGKMLVYHGMSDPLFSPDYAVNWYGGVQAANGGDASNFARLYLIPGMDHCSTGPSTDQFDLMLLLVNWVEQGIAPDSLTASARGPGNRGGSNADVPSTWAPDRTRPLCAYPTVARYNGTGDVNQAANFTCK